MVLVVRIAPGAIQLPFSGDADGIRFKPATGLQPMFIPVTNSEPVAVDAEDYEAVLALGRWHRRPDGGVYTTRRTPAGPRRLTLSTWLAGQRVRYLDGDPLNCRRSNLGAPTTRQRIRTRKLRPLSGTEGTVRRRSGTWTSRIIRDGRTLYTGAWPTREAAHLAYRALKHPTQ